MSKKIQMTLAVALLLFSGAQAAEDINDLRALMRGKGKAKNRFANIVDQVVDQQEETKATDNDLALKFISNL